MATAFLLSAGLCGASATFSLNPSADAFVTTGPTANLVTSNYGGAGAIGVSAPGLAQGEFQSFLKFDLSTAKAAFDTDFGVGQWSIQSITLQLTATAPNNAIFNSSAAGQFTLSWTANNSWTEGSGTPMLPTSSGITFSTASSFKSASDEILGTFSFGGGTSGANVYSLGLAQGLVSDLDDGSIASMDMVAADSTVSALFDSRSFNTSSARPLLIITAVPEPGVLPLTMMAAGTVLGWRRFSRGRI